MKKCCYVGLALFLLLTGTRLLAKDGIPETRFRVIYKDTGKPVEWAAIQIQCFRDYGWFNADEEIIYEDFFFVEAPDGWVTIPRIDAPGTTSYTIAVWVPGCNAIDNPDMKGHRNAFPFNDKTLPRFLKKPLAERVFYVPFKYSNCGGFGRKNSWGGLPYEGLRYEIAQKSIDFSQWPKLTGYYAGWYLEDPQKLQDRRTKEGPFFKRGYCEELYLFLYWTHEEVSDFEKWAKEKKQYPQEEVDAKVKELYDLVRNIICSDIQKKKQRWSGMMLSKAVADDPLIKDCEALKDVQLIDGKCDCVPP